MSRRHGPLGSGRSVDRAREFLEIGPICCCGVTVRPNDLAAMNHECPRHLKAVAFEFADAVPTQGGEYTSDPDTRPEELEERSASEFQCSVESPIRSANQAAEASPYRSPSDRSPSDDAVIPTTARPTPDLSMSACHLARSESVRLQNVQPE